MAVGEGAYNVHTSDGEDNVIFNGVPDWVYEGKPWPLMLAQI